MLNDPTLPRQEVCLSKYWDDKKTHLLVKATYGKGHYLVPLCGIRNRTEAYKADALLKHVDCKRCIKKFRKGWA